MNKKKTIGMMALALSGIAVVSGCSTSDTDKKEDKNVEKFTEEEEKAYVASFSEKIASADDVNTVIKEIDENVDKLSKDEASNMIDGLLYVIHQKYSEMNTKISGLQPVLQTLDKDGVDYNKEAVIKKVEDATTKAFLEDLKKQKYIVQKVGSDFYARPDIKWVLDTYGKYMNEDLKAMTEFSLEENTTAFYNAEVNTFDMDIVVNRILKIEENMKKFPDSFYVESMKNSKNYYYQVYFGTNNEFLVDENKKVLDAIVKHYQKTVEKNPNSQIGKDTKTVLDKLKASNNVVTDNLYVELLDLTGTVTEDVKQDAEVTEEKAEEIVEETKAEDSSKETKATESSK